MATSSSSSSTPSPSTQVVDDLSLMTDHPARPPGHRRAHSEILSLPDDISFDCADLGIVGPTADEADEDYLSMFLDVGPEVVVGEENVGPTGGGGGVSGGGRPRHQHSQSMDGSTMAGKMEMMGTGTDGAQSVEVKKAMSAAKLADLALVDPKRAKRIWANRQSAARSKERKMRYIAELERKLQTLQTEATTLSAQVTMLQRDTNGLTAENSELKLRLQTMEQQVYLQDALNDTLREEVQRLKLATGQMLSNGPMMNFGQPSYGANQQFYQHNNQTMQSILAAHQLQQLQINPQQLHPHQHQQLTPTDMRARGAPVALASPNQRDGGVLENNIAHLE